ncbi:(-)-germacrene D synthase-like [Carya illinoinensis]|uniref:(-)-germacrene D synthase-like n=1 Tax=Carya illinoinensis TaxID=32201 RepID=UPI001C720FB8|nr:(-)-germacrene D synthase-like [Carya illinoinensis]
MSLLSVSGIPSQTQNPSISIVKRPLATFHPSIWGDHFISYNSKSMEISSESLEKVQRLKEKVQSLLMAPVDDISQKLELIDAIQRLGVSYHFESEIDTILQQIHNNDDDTGDSDDLYTVSLRFSLLRQQGYNTPSDVFSKFKDSEGNFKESIIHDVRGILSLYEASHIRVRGEDILDGALHFTTTQLESMVSNLNPSVAAQVRRALERPLRKWMPRLEARHCFSTYPETASFNEVVHNFAKLDFNILQRLHQKEVSELSRRWKEDLGVPEKISYVRDRVVELYFMWILGPYFEPQYSHGRMMLGKVASVVSIMDDTYDAYGTFEELKLFTDAIIRLT